jgi:pimeloyl-ACP methyl ester carboxylesterase
MEGVGLLCLGCCYIVLEIVFYVYVQYVLLPTIRDVRPVPPCFLKDKFELARECLDLIQTMTSYSFTDFIRGWFLYAQLRDIRIGNLDSLLAWVLFVRHFPDLSDEEKDSVFTFRTDMCKQFDVTFEEGFNPDVRHCNFNLETIRTIHHPLIEYAVFNVVEGCCLLKMYTCGFHRYQTTNGMTYWYKKQDYEDGMPRKPPILMLHGISSGWFSYSECIAKFGKNRDVVLVDYSCVRISWINLNFPSNEELNCCVNEILVRHDIANVSLFAHSWGTLISVCLLQMSPSIFSHVTFVDPVGMTIFLPEPVYTLMYKPPVTILDYLVCYFVRYNISIANAMYRNVYWFNVTCLLNDVPSEIGVVVGIAAEDELVPSRAIKDLVTIHNKKRLRTGARPVTLLCFDKLLHGDTVCMSSSIDDLLVAVNISECVLPTT